MQGRSGRGLDRGANQEGAATSEVPFGAESLARFRHQASARQLAVRPYHAPGTALDLDTPADLAWLASREGVRA